MIAYPTEFCFGLGCDPLNQNAVRRILDLKHRPWDQGLIVVADHPQRLRGLVDMTDPDQAAAPLASWPGPHTWLLPARAGVPSWLRGRHATVAVRVSAHPLVQRLCRDSGMALVSTSTNRSGRPPFRNGIGVLLEFTDKIDCILDERVGNASEPSTITDAISGRAVRS